MTRELSIGELFKDRMKALLDQLLPKDATMTERVRCFSAIFSMHAGLFVLKRAF